MSTRYRQSSLTQESLHAILDYDPLSGEFRWKRNLNRKLQWNSRYAGAVAGTINHENGHRYISIEKVQYLASKLVWLYVCGTFPKIDLDHVNGNPSDDRISNLREATFSQNNYNTSTSSNNSSGFKGVSLFRSGKWRAYISINGRQKHLGYFDSLLEAAKAYEEAAQEHQPDFWRT